MVKKVKMLFGFPGLFALFMIWSFFRFDFNITNRLFLHSCCDNKCNQKINILELVTLMIKMHEFTQNSLIFQHYNEQFGDNSPASTPAPFCSKSKPSSFGSSFKHGAPPFDGPLLFCAP